MLYMDIREAILKCALDVLLICVQYFVFTLNPGIAFVIAHTFNMFFNGHFFALERHAGVGKNNPYGFINYVEDLKPRLESKSYISAAAAYGSLSRNVYSPTSDLDLRIVPKSQSVCFFRSCIFAFFERFRAFLCGFPIDLYVFDARTLKIKMDPKEIPIVFFDGAGILKEIYPEGIQAEEFFQVFKSTHAPKR